MSALQTRVLTTLLLLLLPCVHSAPQTYSQNFRASRKARGIDYEAVANCFRGIDIPNDEPPPKDWCMLDLSFSAFLHCMDKNINLRLEGWIEWEDRDFLAGCLSLCYHDGKDEDVIEGTKLGDAFLGTMKAMANIISSTTTQSVKTSQH